MGVQLTCDQCGDPDGSGRTLNALGPVWVERGSVGVRTSEYPTLLHWACITDYVRRRDAEEQEPPF